MMDYGLIFTIIGAAWLAKSLMRAFERMEKSTKKDRAAAANNCAVGYTR